MDDERVRQRYAGKASQEWERLCSTPITRIEYMITSHVLERYLPKYGVILDAGSGPGRYALDLALKGYRVIMLDIVREMLQFGQQEVRDANFQDKVMQVEGSIVSLPYQDNCFDAVICLGAPLSHITDFRARWEAMAEIARVVRPGGRLFMTGMSRLACYRGAVFWLKSHPEFMDQIIDAEKRAGGLIDGSQLWYNFAPGELADLAAWAGLEVIDQIGCEGLANHLPLENLEQVESDVSYWPVWKQILLETCNEPSVVGISNHLLVVASKP